MVLKFNIDKNLGDTPSNSDILNPIMNAIKVHGNYATIAKIQNIWVPISLAQKKKTVDDIRKLKTKLKSCFYFCS